MDEEEVQMTNNVSNHETTETEEESTEVSQKTEVNVIEDLPPRFERSDKKNRRNRNRNRVSNSSSSSNTLAVTNDDEVVLKNRNPSPMPQVQPVQKHIIYENAQNPEQIEQRRGVYGTKMPVPIPSKATRLQQSRTNDTVLGPPPQPKPQPQRLQQPPQRPPQRQYMGPSAMNQKKAVSVHNSIKLLVQSAYHHQLAKKQQKQQQQQQPQSSYAAPPPILKNAVNSTQYNGCYPVTTPRTNQSSYGQSRNSWSQQNKWNNGSSWNNWSSSNGSSSNWNKWGSSSQSNGYNRSNSYGQSSTSYNEPLNVKKPSYTPFRSVSNNNNNAGGGSGNNSSNRSANAQKEYGNSIEQGPTYDDDVICWAYNSFLGCPNGDKCQWVHACYDTSKDSGFDICWAFNSGGCRYGEQCEWRHAEHPNKWRTIRKSRE